MSHIVPKERRPLWTLAELSDFLDISQDTLRRMRRRGDLPGVVPGTSQIWVSIDALAKAWSFPSPYLDPTRSKVAA